MVNQLYSNKKKKKKDDKKSQESLNKYLPGTHCVANTWIQTQELMSFLFYKTRYYVNLTMSLPSLKGIHNP